MKILLINNNTAHIQALNKALDGHDVEVQNYHPGLNFHDAGKDLIVLSGGGGEGQEITDKHKEDKLWYDDEMKFIVGCKKPVVGICMGFEIMAKAWGQDVPELGKLIYENGTISTSKFGHKLFGKHELKQVEAHSWHVPKAPEGFAILAESENGVEIMYNPLKRQIATQFHPELSGALSLSNLIQQVI